MAENIFFETIKSVPTFKKDLILRNFRASDAIALATFYHVPILIRSELLKEKVEVN
ncbi:MAG: bifunctional nuclease family protein [Thaumarchaeota archaeon]|nr:bifunctional nuclease family protein [Nitrososphaerota archaeon]